MKIEILNWSVRVATKDGQIPPAPQAPDRKAFVGYESRPITCDVDGTTKEAAFVARADLSPGDILPGPALIHEPQTTTLVSVDFTAEVDAIGNLVLNQTQKGGAL